MKKHLLSLFALASMAFASSCTSEEIVSQSTGNEVKVTFTTELRYDVKSRAVGDDTECIDELVFAVYDENQELLPSLTQKVSDGKITLSAVKEDGTREATINVILVKGQTYSFAFWAQDKDYTAYSFDEETATVSVSYGQTANNKNADAFFAKINDYTVTGSFEQNVTLKRPFAQVNFLTTNYDITNAKAAGFEPDQSSIVVQNAATSLNVLTGKVSGDMEAEFKLADWIKDETTKILDGNNAEIIFGGSQNATTFKYLATAYFLPTSDVEDVEITASMSAIQSDKSSKAPVELTAPNVKAKRNYRTNIYGNLLTSNGTFYVTVDPGFDGDHSKELEDPTTVVVGTIAEANALFEGGKTNVTIQEAPTSAATINLPETQDAITINFDFDENATPEAITIEYPASATEKPENIEVNGDAGALIINAPQSTVTLNGSYESVEATTASNTLIVPKGVTIGTLTLKQGNAKIYYGAVETIDNTGKVAITWLVDSKEQLAKIATDVNAGKTFLKETIELISDIDLNNEEWTPIGNSTNKFQGIFDGQNHTISNLLITGDKSDVGLFGYTTVGEIKNLTVNNAKVSGYLNVAVVAGTPYTSKYTNIKVIGHVEINGFAYVGTVGGKDAYANWADITVNVDNTSYVKAHSINANGTAYRTYVGGVVGFNGEGRHSFTNITSNIDVKGSTCDVGGLFGIAHYGNQFKNCSSSGNVEIYSASEAADAEEMGGIAGVWHNQTGSTVTFTDCSFTGILKSNITVGIDLTNNTIVGNAYSATGTGTLNIDGNLYKVASTSDMLSAALSDASGNTIITLMGDIIGDVTVVQQEDVKIIIDGNNYDYNGVILVDGKSKRYDTAGLTIQNVNFNGDNISADANIRLGNGNTSTRYTNNVTVKDCTFNSTGEKIVAVKSYTGGDHNLNIIGCTVNSGMHSMLQVTNVEQGLNIAGCKVYSKNGVNLNNTPSFEMSDCTFDTKGYAIRVGVNGEVNTDKKTFTVSNSTLKSACTDSDDAVIVFRSTATNATLTLTNTTVTGTRKVSGNTDNTTIIGLD